MQSSGLFTSQQEQPQQPSSIFQVKVKFSNHKVISLFPLKRTDTIGEVKQKALSRESSEPPNQSLFYDGEELDEDRTLGSYNITHGCILEFEGMKLYVKDYKASSSSELFEIKLTSPENTVQFVKEQLSLLLLQEGSSLTNDIPTSQLRLSFEKSLLSKDNGKLQRYAIHNKDTLQLEPMQLRIQQNDEDEEELVLPNIRPTDTLLDVKQRIWQRLDKNNGEDEMDINCLRLFCQEKPLSDDSCICQHPEIQHGSTLQLEVVMMVYIKHWSGKTFKVDAPLDACVREVQDAIHDALDIPIMYQNLYYQKQHLESDRFLSEYQITDASTLKLKPVQLVIQAPSSEEGVDADEFNVNVDPNDTLDHIKTLIQEETGIPSQQQRLFWLKKNLQLEDGKKTLLDYGLKHRSKVQVVECGEISVTLPDGETSIALSNVSLQEDTVSSILTRLQSEHGLEEEGK